MRGVIFFILLVSTFAGRAEKKSYDVEDRQSQKPVPSLQFKIQYQLSFMNAGIGMPPHFFNGRLQPGFEFGAGFNTIKKPRRSKTEYNVLVGYFAHRSLQRVAYIKPGFGYSIYIYKNLRVKPMFNCSVMLAHQLNDEFRYTGNGTYEKVSPNRMQFMPAAGLEATAPLATFKNYSTGLMLKYEFGLQLPFSDLSALLPVNQIHIGFKIKKI